MTSLIAPGMWIVPIDPLPELAATIAVFVEDKPHLCTDIDFIVSAFSSYRGKCMSCGNDEIYLKVAEHPRYCFCPTHWRPVLSPKVGAFDALLAPAPSDLVKEPAR